MFQRSSASRRRSTAALALSAALIVVAGCGSDSSAESESTEPESTEPATSPASAETGPTETGPTETGPATSASAGTPLKIGLLAATTGDAAAGQRNIDDLAAAWEQWTNDQGGINGHPVEVIWKESAGEPATSMAAAKELVEQENVVAIVASDSSTENSWGPYLQQEHMPVVGSFGFSSDVWGKLDNFFTLKTDVMGIVAGPLLAAQAIGATTFGAVVCAENPGCAQAEQLYQPLLQQIGIDYAGITKAAFSDSSYTAQCLVLMDAGADYIQINLTTTGATRFIEDCSRQGYTGTYGLADGTVLASAMTDLPEGAKVFGVIDGFPWWLQDGPPADFQAALSDAQLDPADYGNSAYTATWAALETFKKAMADAPANATSDDVFTAMYGLKDEDLGGLLAQKLNFTPGQPAPAVLCYWFYSYEDGAFKTVDESSPSGNSVAEGELKSSCFTPSA